MVIKGFRFGMILQFAIGPVFLYLFKTATESGVFAAESGVLAATLMDAVFVTLSILGIGALLDKPGVKQTLKYFGAVILSLFGLSVILGVFGINILPAAGHMSKAAAAENVFLTTFILTASSPLSILFWTGVFAGKVSCEGFGGKEMWLFGLGAVLATLIFLGVCVFLISLLHPVMTNQVTGILNFTVGLVLIGFALNMLLMKN